MLPFGHGVSPSGEVWDACAARSKVGPVMGLRPLLILMPNPVLRALGRHRRRCRRAVRHENQSFKAQQSRDLLLISGRVDVANTPPGLRPFCPPCIPPEAPPKKGFPNSLAWRGQRGICCGSFPHSLRSLRRSPSAPRYAKCRFRLESDSVSARYR